MKQSKKDALTKVLPLKSSTSKKQEPPPPVPVPPTSYKSKTDELIEHEKLVNKILKYQGNKRFGTTIQKDLGIKHSRAQLSKMKNANLETILHRIRTHLNTRNMDQVFEHMAAVTAKGYEEVVTGFGYNIEGFSDLLMANPAFYDALERWKIERTIPDIPPSLQLGYIVASTTYLAHVKNEHLVAVREKKTEPPKKPQKVEAPSKEDRLKSNLKPGDIII